MKRISIGLLPILLFSGCSTDGTPGYYKNHFFKQEADYSNRQYVKDIISDGYDSRITKATTTIDNYYRRGKIETTTKQKSVTKVNQNITKGYLNMTTSADTEVTTKENGKTTKDKYKTEILEWDGYYNYVFKVETYTYNGETYTYNTAKEITSGHASEMIMDRINWKDDLPTPANVYKLREGWFVATESNETDDRKTVTIDGVKHEYTNRERYQVYVDFKNGGINYWYVYKELISEYNPYSKELYDKAKLISYSYKKVEYELDGKCDEVDNGELNKKYENTKFISDINLYCWETSYRVTSEGININYEALTGSGSTLVDLSSIYRPHTYEALTSLPVADPYNGRRAHKYTVSYEVITDANQRETIDVELDLSNYINWANVDVVNTPEWGKYYIDNNDEEKYFWVTFTMDFEKDKAEVVGFRITDLPVFNY